MSASENVPAASPFNAKRFFARWGLISLVVLVLLVIVESVLTELQSTPTAPSAAPASEPGATFSSLAEFLQRQEAEGYVFLGRFQDRWPATIVNQRTAQNEISFELNGGKHRYPGYDGYTLKTVRLQTSAGTEAVVVLRSAQKNWL